MTIDGNNLVLLALGCVCLCGIGFVLLAGFSVVGGFFEIFSSVIEMALQIISGGPISWCGCLFVLFVCGGGTLLAIMLAQGLSSCGTPQAINFCSLFGQ